MELTGWPLDFQVIVQVQQPHREKMSPLARNLTLSMEITVNKRKLKEKGIRWGENRSIWRKFLHHWPGIYDPNSYLIHTYMSLHLSRHFP